MKIILIFLLFSGLKNICQDKQLTDIISYPLYIRGISEADITIPSEFFPSGEKLPSNEVRFMLPVVKEMMTAPLKRSGWIDSLMWLKDSSCISVITSLFGIIYPSVKTENKDYYKDIMFQKINTIALTELVEENVLLSERISASLTGDEIKFIRDKLKLILDHEDNQDISDIFRFNNNRDSLIEISKSVIGLLGRTDLQHIYELTVNSFTKFHSLYRELAKDSLILAGVHEADNRIFHHVFRSKSIKIAIGGYGSNTYKGDYDLIIDLGGNDVYRLQNSDNIRFRCIIDLEGNDYYSSESSHSLAGAFFSASYVFDMYGDDIYEAKGFGNLASAVAGIAVLLDENGNDIYKGHSFSTGAGCFGLGLLIDRKGNDLYIANSYSQGFGLTLGCGAILDIAGNDSYLVDLQSLDIGRYEDHYVSMCQGYGLGIRPFYAGGVGLIIEGEGNDIYNTDIFGQGGAYWYSLGLIADRHGNDKYNGYQYSQGAGIHLAVGLLKDYHGWDFYQSNGVSQGCGHDFGFGLLWDMEGNDNYSAYSLSQGAGNANGIGILVDQYGTDGYLNKFPSTSRGYGNSRREFGSIGIFVDAEGSDYYSQSGNDSTVTISSDWGILTDLDNIFQGERLNDNQFKIPVDSNREYSLSDYFTMAKTIEPRFSHWKDYGFSKLIQDSLNTAEYISGKFNTTDHRDVQVFRILAHKIPHAVSENIAGRLMLYLKGSAVFTENEISMMCYIAGETRYPATARYLLELTYDHSIRIRASAVNALGKINYESSDTDFINKVTNRLKELHHEKPEGRLYRKDIAFALSNYRTSTSYEILFEMLDDPYWGVRLAAAEGLKKLGNISSNINGDMFGQLSPVALIAFIHSLEQLSDDELMKIYHDVSAQYNFNDEAVIYNMISLMKRKHNDIISEEIKKLESKTKLKIR